MLVCCSPTHDDVGALGILDVSSLTASMSSDPNHLIIHKLSWIKPRKGLPLVGTKYLRSMSGIGGLLLNKKLLNKNVWNPQAHIYFLVHPDQLSFAVDVQLCPFWRKLIGATLVFYVCSKRSNNIRQLAYFHLVHSFPTHNRTNMLLLREVFWKGRPCSSRCWKSALAMAKASIRLMGSWCESVRISCRGDKLVVYLTYILHGKLAYPNEQRDKNTIWAGLLQ